MQNVAQCDRTGGNCDVKASDVRPLYITLYDLVGKLESEVVACRANGAAPSPMNASLAGRKWMYCRRLFSKFLSVF